NPRCPANSRRSSSSRRTFNHATRWPTTAATSKPRGSVLASLDGGKRRRRSPCPCSATTAFATTAPGRIASAPKDRIGSVDADLRSSNQIDKLAVRLELAKLARQLLHCVDMMHRRQRPPQHGDGM